MFRGVKHSNGKSSTISLEKVGSSKDLIWIDVTTKNKKDLDEIEKNFNLYPRDLEDSIDAREIPRLAQRKNYTFIVLRSLTEKSGSIPLGIFLSKKYIITIHRKDIKPLKDFFGIVLTKEGKEFFRRGVDFLFYKIVSEINRYSSGQLEKFNDKIEEMEDRVLNNKVENTKELLPLKKNIGAFKKALSSNRAIVEKLQNKTSKFISDRNYLDLNNLHVEILQAESTVDYQREKLTVVSEMHMTAISNRLNDIMRSFTVLASVFLLPMLISGIWGMNFAEIPFYNDKYGFYAPIVMMVASIIFLMVFFKHKKWV